jgi:hypothetical protein
MDTMSGTRRTPIKRQPTGLKFTPAVIRLFDNMRRCCCTCLDADGPADCPGCKRYWRLHSDLVDELGTMPWQWPCVQDPNTQPSHIGWKPNLEAQERWRMLAKASREARRAAERARAARRAATAPMASPEPPEPTPAG